MAVNTIAPPTTMRRVGSSPPARTAKSAANTGSMLMMIAQRVGARWAWAQVWANRANDPASAAM